MTERLTDDPAAWLCEDLAWEGETSVTTDKAHAERRAAYATAWRVTPLYTHRRVAPADDLYAALTDARDVMAGLAEHILKSDKVNTKGMFADLQRARLAADAALAKIAKEPAP
ncbi:hypothetical protein [Paracoccus hibiscisoli]|uniref:Uncharacterized protein n=1 Tax=Paracoccus hibiscisoli TaxID=2023261 RepID=A0A4U0QUI3_9RHOB|nr:hypothetical protein [Paracoccus hibiscisoli]TJZ85791.1 hypothetical protein FA740_05165 [Paracoccus hibiscisoli]